MATPDVKLRQNIFSDFPLQHAVSMFRASIERLASLFTKIIHFFTKPSPTSRLVRIATLTLSLIAAAASGCGTIPDVHQLLQMNALDLEHPRFIGPHGSLTHKQGQRLVARIQSHQETPTDILERHIDFEQTISNVPLVVGNNVTLLKNADETYKAMLTAIHGARENINLEMFIISDGQIG